MSNYKTIISNSGDRKTRIQDHTKRPGTIVREVVSVDKNTVREGVPELFAIKGKGFYWVTKHNNKLEYLRYTGLDDTDIQKTSSFSHASTHESGGIDTVNHDSLTGFVAAEHVSLPNTTANVLSDMIDDDSFATATALIPASSESIKTYVDNKTVSIPISFETFDATPARNTEANLHGGLLLLGSGVLGPATPANDLVVTKGIGKVLIVVNAGTDLAGTITISGTVVNRETGASGADTDVITVDAVTTDTSSTGGKAGGAVIHGLSGAYISSKWFQGTVTLSTSTLNLSDVDVYHVSFDQFNDQSNITLDTFDANLFTTNAAAEFDAYLYSLEVTGSKATVAVQASLHVGTDGLTAIANKYWRLRRGNIAKALDGATDGIWVDVWYLNVGNTYCQDVNIKIWATQETTLT